MADRWEVYRQKVSEAFAKLADTTQRFTKIGKIRMDILSLKKEIEHQQILLGQRVYQLVKEGQADQIASDEVIQDHVSRIDELKEQVAAKEAEIEELRKEKEEAQPEEPTGPVAAQEATQEETAEEPEAAAEAPSEEEPAAEAKPKPKRRTRKKSSSEAEGSGENQKA